MYPALHHPLTPVTLPESLYGGTDLSRRRNRRWHVGIERKIRNHESFAIAQDLIHCCHSFRAEISDNRKIALRCFNELFIKTQ